MNGWHGQTGLTVRPGMSYAVQEDTLKLRLGVVLEDMSRYNQGCESCPLLGNDTI